MLLLNPLSFTISITLLSTSILSFNHAHERVANHPAFIPIEYPLAIPADGMSPESVLEKRDDGSSVVKGAQLLSAATLETMMNLFGDLSLANLAEIARKSSVAAIVASTSTPSVIFVFPSSTPPLPSPSPSPSPSPAPSLSPVTTSTSTSIPLAKSTPVLDALLHSYMPGGLSIDKPSIFPTFPPVPTTTTEEGPIVPSIFPSLAPVNIPTVFPTFAIIPTNTPAAKAVAKADLTLSPPPSSNCVSQYTNTESGAVYGPGLGDFPMNPRPSTFVKRSGSKLTLDGQPYRITGPNIYWLGLDENVSSSPSYPSQGRVREAMAIVVAMSGNTIRAHTLGISTGNPLSVWPSSGNTNEAALKVIDYAIFAARNYGLRLIIPLTDDYAYYHGGKGDFVRWATGKDDPGAFYTNDSVIKLFKAYTSVILNRVNSYTGVAYKDDPTILAWETGNELGAYFLSGGAPPASFTNEIATYIKSIAPNQLVADGSDGLVNSNSDLATEAFKVAGVDLVTDHFYPAEKWLLSKDNGYLLSQSKNYFVGELDWTGNFGGDDVKEFYSQLESMSGSGSMIWSVFGHDDSCCNYISHNDGYSLEYPNGNNAALQAMILLLVQHWSRMQGLTPPTSLPAVSCSQPELIL